ncbi:hypothetical protein TNCV_5068671 [Trichonephila clavipes]|nr:hypothetical protein TNCV_5068671 [Trichonephila clavipes]
MLCCKNCRYALDTDDSRELTELNDVAFILYYSSTSMFHRAENNFMLFLRYYMMPGNNYILNEFLFFSSVPHSDRSFQTGALVFDRIKIKTVPWPGQQLKELRTGIRGNKGANNVFGMKQKDVGIEMHLFFGVTSKKWTSVNSRCLCNDSGE